MARAATWRLPPRSVCSLEEKPDDRGREQNRSAEHHERHRLDQHEADEQHGEPRHKPDRHQQPIFKLAARTRPSLGLRKHGGLATLGLAAVRACTTDRFSLAFAIRTYG